MWMKVYFMNTVTLTEGCPQQVQADPGMEHDMSHNIAFFLVI